MTNPNIFIEQGTGEYVCPSGCLETDECEKIAIIEALAKSSAKLGTLSRPEVAQTMHAVRGDHLPLIVEKKFGDELESALGSSCLKFYLAQNGLTKS